MDTDVAVIGGGSAGLQAALTLGRMRFDVVVVDAGKPSNAPAHAIGGLLGAHDWAPLDCWPPAEGSWPSCLRCGSSTARRHVDADRSVTLPDGSTLAARAVVLATGMDYAVPDVPGSVEPSGNHRPAHGAHCARSC